MVRCAHIGCTPTDEYEKIKKYPEVKWGAVARKVVIQYLNEYERFLESSKSKQSESEKTSKC